jgi:hypothetical protein
LIRRAGAGEHEHEQEHEHNALLASRGFGMQIRREQPAVVWESGIAILEHPAEKFFIAGVPMLDEIG